MQKITTYLLPIILLMGCGSGQSYTVEVQNLSAKSFDSVQVFVNTNTNGKPTVQFGNLLPGETAPPLAVGKILGTQQPKIKGMAIFYAADTVVRYQAADVNSATNNNYYKISIDSNLRIKWEERK